MVGVRKLVASKSGGINKCSWRMLHILHLIRLVLLGTCLAAARSRSRFDSPPDCHSFRSRRSATSRGRLKLVSVCRTGIQRFCFEIYVSKSKFPHTLQQPARGPWAFQKQAISNRTPLVFSPFLSLFRARGRYIINFLVIWRSICAGGTLTRAKKCDTIKNGKLCAKTVLRCGIV